MDDASWWITSSSIKVCLHEICLRGPRSPESTNQRPGWWGYDQSEEGTQTRELPAGTRNCPTFTRKHPYLFDEIIALPTIHCISPFFCFARVELDTRRRAMNSGNSALRYIANIMSWTTKGLNIWLSCETLISNVPTHCCSAAVKISRHESRDCALWSPGPAVDYCSGSRGLWQESPRQFIIHHPGLSLVSSGNVGLSLADKVETSASWG